MIGHLYIHIPFCRSKCYYCAFYSETGRSKKVIKEYPPLLLQELKLRFKSAQEMQFLQPQTVYIGGGTPSLLGVEGFRELASGLKDSVDLSSLKEWSVELNPSSVTPELLTCMRESGVNRITFGAQSFNNAILELINRAHDAEDVIQCVEWAKNAGFTNIGIDLIAGLPGVTQASWNYDLSTALTLEVTHISVYNLSVEPQSRLAVMIEEGMCIPDEEQQLNLLSIAEESLSKGGFNRYEISNYALNGYECKHNLGIWRGGDYLGLGPSAASRIGRQRIENHPNLDAYRDSLQRNIIPPRQVESLSEDDDAVERALFALRLKEGFNPFECAKKFAISQHKADEWENTLIKLSHSGAVERGGKGWRLTRRGYEVCDYVIRELI
ncbi:MAG: radical SAM family heme chaperone HemW [Kiritimatiellae bacterium]|jgi:oxygen-independent coproporphyrinogen-3 oxidase|nr:radical SAM family heme chaperone HemW [Kiritimatiellia bacterium]